MSDLKAKLTEDMKAAMRGGEKTRLGTIRLILSAVKQVEVDERKELSDQDLIAILDKMSKQRRESITSFEKANREDLAEIERKEIVVLQEYLPEQLSSEEITTLVDGIIAATGAASIKDMGKVMGQIRPKVQGRADMAEVSALIKARLGA